MRGAAPLQVVRMVNSSFSMHYKSVPGDAAGCDRRLDCVAEPADVDVFQLCEDACSAVAVAAFALMRAPDPGMGLRSVVQHLIELIEMVDMVDGYLVDHQIRIGGLSSFCVDDQCGAGGDHFGDLRIMVREVLYVVHRLHGPVIDLRDAVRIGPGRPGFR